MAAAPHFLSPESLAASGRDGAKLSLPSLQSKMKCDPEGYETELLLLRRHFESSLYLFQHQSALNPSSDSSVAKELGDMAMFLAHVTPFYTEKLADFPRKLEELLSNDSRSLPGSLRVHLAQAMILLVNRKIVNIEETLELFMELQVLDDRTLRKLCFSHIIHSIRRMNQKHRDEGKNRKLQNILFSMLQEEDESRAKRALVVLCDLHRRKVWFDDRTANAICTACFHPSSRIMISVLSFLLGYNGIEEQDYDEHSSSEDDTTTQKPQIFLNRMDIYKAQKKGTSTSKKKKKAKLQRVLRNMKRQQRISSEIRSSGSYTPLTHLKDAQGFAEKLFSRLQKSDRERFEVKMMMLKVIAQTIGLHRLLVLNFYPFLQKYVQPHQRDVTSLLAATAEACHDMVPPDAVEPMFKQIVNQFVHDHSRTEAIAVGLNVVREICLRMPLLMTDDLLQDLVLYKKSHEKAVSTAARSLITLFREICPSLLLKKDRGRPSNPKAKPKAFGEVSIVENVPGIELLENVESASDGDDDDDEDDSHDSDINDNSCATARENTQDISEANSGMEVECKNLTEEEEEEEDDDDDNDNNDDSDDNNNQEEEELQDFDGCSDDLDSDDGGGHGIDVDDDENDANSDIDDDVANKDDNKGEEKKCKARKRKLLDYGGQLDSANTSLRALKRLAGSKLPPASEDTSDGFLSNEHFKLIKELRVKRELKAALSQQGIRRKSSDTRTAAFKVPSSEELTKKRVDPAKLEANIKIKLSKEQRLAIVKAGREDRGKYLARAAVKQKKTGGLSNRQKEHKKAMPFAAKKAKVAKSRQQKRKQSMRGGKQFRGKKAWKK